MSIQLNVTYLFKVLYNCLNIRTYKHLFWHSIYNFLCICVVSMVSYSHSKIYHSCFEVHFSPFLCTPTFTWNMLHQWFWFMSSCYHYIYLHLELLFYLKYILYQVIDESSMILQLPAHLSKSTTNAEPYSSEFKSIKVSLIKHGSLSRNMHITFNVSNYIVKLDNVTNI